MEKEDKFYYIKSIGEQSFSRNRSSLMRWNPAFSVEVDENVEHCQYISLAMLKLGQRDSSKPASTKYERVTPVIKEIFLNHYSLAIKYLHEAELDEGEMYLYTHSGNWIEAAWYSKNEKNKANVIVNCMNNVEDLWLSVSGSIGYSRRREFRKHGEAITMERFKQFLHLTLQFLYDSDSYSVFQKDYISNFFLLAKGEENIGGFIFSTEKAFEEILIQLERRKDNIAKRLIESDNDPAIERAKLRGELEGIDYAIKTVKSNR